MVLVRHVHHKAPELYRHLLVLKDLVLQEFLKAPDQDLHLEDSMHLKVQASLKDQADPNSHFLLKDLQAQEVSVDSPVLLVLLKLLALVDSPVLVLVLHLKLPLDQVALEQVHLKVLVYSLVLLVHLKLLRDQVALVVVHLKALV